MSSISQLPYVCCVSCGNQLGHLFEHYYTFTKNLNDYHDGLVSGDMAPTEVDRSLFIIEDMGYNGYNIWDSFLKGYYTWLQDGDNRKKANMTASGLVMQALLADYNLKSESDINKHLPFNFSGQDCVRICCKTALLTDNSKAVY